MCGVVCTIILTEDMTITAMFEEIPNAIEDAGEDNSTPSLHKVMRDGIMYIVMPDGKTYTTTGAVVR